MNQAELEPRPPVDVPTAALYNEGMRLLFLSALAALAIVVATPADAQRNAPPYEKDLQRLAEVLGAVHYLRELCGADEGQTWRSMMQQLIDAENPTQERRSSLIERFNRGYRGFEQSYHACNATAVNMADRYMEEAAELAGGIATRYGE